jgi:hypothetical protein
MGVPRDFKCREYELGALSSFDRSSSPPLWAPGRLEAEMCDISEEEQTEYLLWCEAARARAAEPAPSPPPRRVRSERTSVVPPTPAEA